MRSIKWFGAAILSVAGVAALLVGLGDAQALVIRDKQGPVALSGAAQTAAATIVSSCWDGTLADVVRADIARGFEDGHPTNVFQLTIQGSRTLSLAQAWAKAQAGVRIPGDRVVPEMARCTLDSAAQRNALQTIAAAVWSGPIASMHWIRIEKAPDGSGIQVMSEGVTTITQAESNARLNAGIEVDPVGVVQQ